LNPQRRITEERTLFNAICARGRAPLRALALIGFLAACSAPPTPTPQFTLRIGVYPVVAYQPYFVMQEQGFAKQNGLQLEEKTPFAGGAAVIEAMAAGSVDVGYIGSVPVLTAAQLGLIPGTVVPVAANDFADPDHQSVGVLAAPSINSWKDLEGQPIAVNSVDSIQGAAIKGRLQQEGVKDYTLVEISFANMGLAVAGGNVAAATMVEPFLTHSLSRGDGKLLGWIIGGPPFERLEVTLIVFSADSYRNNPQAVKAFLRAHLQAVQWINQDPDAARSILTKRLALSEDRPENDSDALAVRRAQRPSLAGKHATPPGGGWHPPRTHPRRPTVRRDFARSGSGGEAVGGAHAQPQIVGQVAAAVLADNGVSRRRRWLAGSFRWRRHSEDASAGSQHQQCPGVCQCHQSVSGQCALGTGDYGRPAGHQGLFFSPVG
jgi:NitT/TauT family transport system substrate-binding protein